MTVPRCSAGFLAAWLVAATVLLGLPSRSAMAGSRHCEIPRDLTRTPPDPVDSPTSVHIGLFILEIASIDEVRESFTADLLMVAGWRDPRLAESVLGSSLDGCLFGIGDVWSPRLGIVNQRAAWSRGDHLVRVGPEGDVDYRVGYFGEFASPLDLRRFPFDEQRLGISISTDYGPTEVVLVGDAATTGVLEGASIAGWEILGVDEAPVSRAVEAAGAVYGITEFSLSIERERGYYVWKIFLPLTFIVGMASVVFWLDPKQVGSQIGVSTASVFTLIAFLLSLNRFMPRVSYLTRADLFVLGVLALVFGALAQCVATSRLAQSGRVTLAGRLDDVARWLYPMAFVVIVVLVLTLP
jgi:hypothetical protein